MVTIRKRSEGDGTVYEIEAFSAYAQELRNRNIDVPLVQYRVHISRDHERALRAAGEDLERQIALFFRIGPASGIPYEIREA